MNTVPTGEKTSQARRGAAALAVGGLVAIGSIVFGSATQAATTPNPDLATSCAPLNVVVAVDASASLSYVDGPSANDLGAAVSAIGASAKQAGNNVRIVTYSDSAQRVDLGGTTDFAPADTAAIDAWVSGTYASADYSAAPEADWAAMAAGVAAAPGDLVIWLAAGPSTTAAAAEADLDSARSAGAHLLAVAVGPKLVAGSASLGDLTNTVDTDTANRITWYAAGAAKPDAVTNDVVVTDAAGAATAMSSILATVPDWNCGLSLTKDSATMSDTDGNKVASPGDVVSYGFTVENTGNVDLSDVTISSADGTLNDVECVTELAAGAAESCTSKYTLTAADVKDGKVGDAATVTATAPDTSKVESAPVDVTMQVAAAIVPPSSTTSTTSSTSSTTSTSVAPPPLDMLLVVKSAKLAKDADGDKKVSLGDTIEYTFSIKNGTAGELKNVTLKDLGPGGADLSKELTGSPIATLAAGATDSTTYSAKHVVTQADVNAGAIENQATVTAVDAAGKTVEVKSDTGTDPALQTVSNPFATETTNPGGLITNDAKDPKTDPTAVTVSQVGAMTLAVAGNVVDENESGTVDVGDIVVLSYSVTNSGSVLIDKVDVTDELNSKLDCELTKIAAGATDECTAPYTLTAEDVAATSVTSRATAVATIASGLTITDATKETIVALTLEGTGTLSVGDRVWYDTNRDGIQNNSEVGLTGVTVVLTSTTSQPKTTKTDSTGRYQFDNLAEGTYGLTFTAPAGYTFTTANAGTDDSLDSDVTSSGTATFTLSSTVVADSDVAGLDLTNPTLDAGMIVGSSTSTSTSYRYNNPTTSYRSSGTGSRTGSGNTYTGGNAARIGGFAFVFAGLGMVARLVARGRQTA